ncbi:hypothetical protein Gotri_026218 [Gossypium trilobum]|uniref:Uncharacterized protein n=1 Tax=Gossypium trilobum TaxID=34281 RepID=A0A7J9FWX3_9ROSI|nr:hypothetical protein [Gossypium trilobum]
MAFYVDEEEVWKCPSHPSKRRRTGICVGSVGRVSNLIESEPAFRRSRSLAIPFLRSKPEDSSERNGLAGRKSKTPSFWSIFRASNKSKRYESEDDQSQGEKERRAAADEERRRRMMRKSRSVAVTKGKSWYFPSPMKVLRQTRVSKLVFQERSPLYRG